MVLGWQRPGRVGRRRIQSFWEIRNCLSFFVRKETQQLCRNRTAANARRIQLLWRVTIVALLFLPFQDPPNDHKSYILLIKSDSRKSCQTMDNPCDVQELPLCCLKHQRWE